MSAVHTRFTVARLLDSRLAVHLLSALVLGSLVFAGGFVAKSFSPGLTWWEVASCFNVEHLVYGSTFTGLEPFEHEAFTPAADSDEMRPLAVWLAMVLSFGFFGPWIIYFSVSNSDAAIAVATVLQGLHVFATTVLTQAFPENWIWWATVMPCFFVQGRLAQFMLMQFGLGLCSRSSWRRIRPAKG